METIRCIELPNPFTHEQTSASGYKIVPEGGSSEIAPVTANDEESFQGG